VLGVGMLLISLIYIKKIGDNLSSAKKHVKSGRNFLRILFALQWCDKQVVSYVGRANANIGKQQLVV